jgi:hypothetical protein
MDTFKGLTNFFYMLLDCIVPLRKVHKVCAAGCGK